MAAALCGCPQEITTALNGTPGADASIDGGVPDSSTGVDIGHSDAGAFDGATTDARPADAGDVGFAELTFGEMQLPMNTSPVQCVWGRSATEIYAGTSNGKLLKYDGSNWTQDAWNDPGNRGLTDIWGNDDVLAISSEVQLHLHRNGGVESHLASSARSIHGIWGFSENDIYVAVEQTNGTNLQHFDGMALTERYRPTGVGQLYAVWGPSADLVYFGGSNGKLFKIDRGVVSEERVEIPAGYSDGNTLTFRRIRGIGGEVYAVGSRHVVFQRDVDSVWRAVYNPLLTDEFYDLTGQVIGGAPEIYVVGRKATPGPAARFWAGGWSHANVSDRFHLFGIHRVSLHEYIAVGMIRNTNTGSILIGRR